MFFTHMTYTTGHKNDYFKVSGTYQNVFDSSNKITPF
jgi:hypothetical protein